MKTHQILLCALGILAVVARTEAQDILYGSTSSGQGELYTLNPATGGVVQDIGPLDDASSVNYSVTGLAFDPITGVLYGSTGGFSGHDLLSINPSTGLVTVIGSFNFNGGSATMSDLDFTQAGTLYGIGSSGGANLYSINLGTGQATVVGPSGVSFTQGGGLAISSTGVFYGAPIPGDFGTYNSTTGAYNNIATPTYPEGPSSSFAALAFNGSTLYGDNLLAGGSGATDLVTIDPTTGDVTDIGPSVAHLDAIAFSEVPEPSTMSLFLGAGAMTLLRIWRRK
jgi:hypothetical protein